MHASDTSRNPLNPFFYCIQHSKYTCQQRERTRREPKNHTGQSNQFKIQCYHLGITLKRQRYYYLLSLVTPYYLKIFHVLILFPIWGYLLQRIQVLGLNIAIKSTKGRQYLWAQFSSVFWGTDLLSLFISTSPDSEFVLNLSTQNAYGALDAKQNINKILIAQIVIRGASFVYSQ